MPDTSKIKGLLFATCQQYVNNRISHATEAMQAAQDAANEEIRSSAGDKYSTDRAVMQIEREKHAKQLAEAQKLVRALDQIHIERGFKQIDLGSLVETNAGLYFLAISIGKINIQSINAFIISPASPLGQQLLGKKEGDTILFNGRTISIDKIS